MNTMRPLRLYHDNSTNLVDPLLWRIALTHSSLTISPAFSVGFDGTWQGSPFYEFDCVAASRPQLDILPVVRRSYSVPDAAARLLPIIRQRIIDTWQPSKFHFIYHSSGYDSRVISSIIRSLYLERGDDWLGKVVFATNKWEATPFREIMLREGWTPDQYYIHDEAISDDLYFLHSINLDHAYRDLNAPCPIPANLWYYLPLGYAHDHFLPPEDCCQAYTGYWSNETHETFLMSDREWYTRWGYWYSFNVMATLPMYFFDLVLVFPDLPYQKALVEMSVATTGDAKELRKALADLACPECADVPNLGYNDRHHPIANSIRDVMVAQYHDTWYGKHVCREFIAPTTSEFSPEWGKWSLASLCEFLRSQGREIKIK